MSCVKTVLVVDDNPINRTILNKILSEQYPVLEAENGQIALEMLAKHHNEIAAVMLDLVMPVMDGYEVLEAIRKNDIYCELPIVVTTGNDNHDSERKALSLGAWDFVSKPYDADIILFRLKNAIDRSQLSALKQLQYLTEYDALTGIYNKTKLFNATRAMLDANRNESFVFLRFDVDRFQLINSFFGMAEGDKLLKYIAKNMAEDAKKCSKATYGRIESDVVALCAPYDKELIEYMAVKSKQTLAQFNLNYDIVPSIGIYVIDDPSISVEEMYNRATLAAKNCKGSYVKFYAYYEASMSATLNAEQEITNEMNFALENEQFQIYLQPQYNIHTNLPCGAEALVRWIHPIKGLISPGKFIPIFERNGFITKLDYYVWEQACKCLHNWIKRGITPYPLSVNISRVNLYNPNLVEMLLELVNHYELQPSLLNLELTESAYTDNPATMKKVMSQLQSYGFVVMMDDFGSGYSSLSLLKDIMIDVLKIDMQFLSVSEFQGRGENIIASVIRMAQWLNIPVIAEGAETLEQVEFLRSVGCDFAQGFYFARPMPVKEYEELCLNSFFDTLGFNDKRQESYHFDDLFAAKPKSKALFNNALQAAAIYEFSDDKIEPIRVNEAYYALFGYDGIRVASSNVINLIDPKYREQVLNAFRNCVKSQGVTECEYLRNYTARTPVWVHAKLNYATMVGNKHIIIGELTDITMRHELDAELQKYKTAWLSDHKDTHTVLIIDDSEIDRTTLKKILKNSFSCLEAENDKVAIEILQEKQNQVGLILLDVDMPMVNGKEFLQYKQTIPELSGIPVIIITAKDNSEQQISAFSLGINDYIVKPFIPAVVTRRISNVLESSRRFKEMVREYNAMSAQVKTDLMTGLINRVSAEEMISRILENATDTCIMMMMDVDNFKQINDTYGHNYGDRVIRTVAQKLCSYFRKGDIIARMGGDEFAIFISNISDTGAIERKAHRLCESIANLKIDGEPAAISCSLGIAFSNKSVNSFSALYQNSDKALYSAKCHGRNSICVYGEETAATSVVKWMNDAESVLSAIKDSVYVCDKNTYELIYANESLCKLMGIYQAGCKGKKCYEVLMHRTKPCEFCCMQNMKNGRVYTRLFRVPNVQRVFLMRGETINRNGTDIHLEVAVDITEIENKNLQWSEVESYGNE